LIWHLKLSIVGGVSCINASYFIAGFRYPSDFIAHTVLTPQDVVLTTATTEASVANAHWLQQRFTECCRQLETAHSEWVSFSE